MGTATGTTPEKELIERDPIPSPGVGGPVSVPWREGTLTRARELEALTRWLWRNRPPERGDGLAETEDLLVAIEHHLAAAREAAEHRGRLRKGDPHERSRRARRASLLERAISNLDAAEAHLLNLAPPAYVLGQMPSLLNHVQRHLPPTDPRRKQVERIAAKLGVGDPDDPSRQDHEDLSEESLRRKRDLILQERGQIVSAVRGASSAGLREQVRVRSFRNVLVATTVVLWMLVAAVAVVGAVYPTAIPLCFQPESGGQTMLVCPTGQTTLSSTPQEAGALAPDVDDVVEQTVSWGDLLVVELIGLAAAAVAAAAAIRNTRGSSERYWIPVALAALKLPTGAMTAFLGLLLMRGQFVPGLTALDTSAQILAWALVFGYAQQLFTRFVDQQADVVLDKVRDPDRTAVTPA